MATQHHNEQTTSANLVQTSIRRAKEATMTLPNEEQPLLQSNSDTTWKPPRAFLWIELGMYNLQTFVPKVKLTEYPTAIMLNVFLGGFDGTITASTYAVISSEFNAANTASWLTTSYLITSTAFQPLYGRFSDIFGRRVCFFTATISFMAGCLGCAVAKDIVFLNMMRALTGIGGGGLMTMGRVPPPSDEMRWLTLGNSHGCQLGSYSFPPTWHVPGSPEWLERVWRYLRGVFWRCHRRHDWMAMVFLVASACVADGSNSRLFRSEFPNKGE